jgi:hypothetical protein
MRVVLEPPSLTGHTPGPDLGMLGLFDKAVEPARLLEGNNMLGHGVSRPDGSACV